MPFDLTIPDHAPPAQVGVKLTTTDYILHALLAIVLGISLIGVFLFYSVVGLFRPPYHKYRADGQGNLIPDPD